MKCAFLAALLVTGACGAVDDNLVIKVDRVTGWLFDRDTGWLFDKDTGWLCDKDMEFKGSEIDVDSLGTQKTVGWVGSKKELNIYPRKKQDQLELTAYLSFVQLIPIDLVFQNYSVINILN